MSVAAGQRRTFLRLVAQLRPHWRRDVALASRIQMLLARERSFGSRDRRLYRELIHVALRYLPWIEPLLDADPDGVAAVVAWLAADTPSTRSYRAALLEGWPPCPPGTMDKAAVLGTRMAIDAAALAAPLPPWFRTHGPAAFAPEQVDALLARAPLWVRLQTSAPAAVFADFAGRGWTWERSDVLPSAVRLPAETDVTKTEGYRSGLVEVQDLGSQMILESAGVARGGRWLDACAGAGGKTLQLASLLGAAGRVDALDPRPAALEELRSRARRAGFPLAGAPPPAAARAAALIATPDRPGGAYDGVLVDAPCSGSGTWRRAPHLKWTTSPATIERAAVRQLALLRASSAHLRPGGQLVYATCSLSRRENEDVIAAFLGAHPAFSPSPPAETFGFVPDGHGLGLTILPALHDTDGFFVASLRRQA